MQNPIDLHRQRQALKQMLLTLPLTVGDLAVQFYKARFRAEGWYDASFVKWQARSPNAKRNKGRAILTSTGRLRRSIRIAKLTQNIVTIGTDVPYARVHNEGFNGTVHVKAHTRGLYKKKKAGTGKLTKTGKERMKTVSELQRTTPVGQHNRKMHMPKRQYMGESQYLNRIITRKISTEVLKAFK
ncbi:MAG: phage virion morphogenesis protein [Bacteroidetes bacterium]|nr:phage virion morphogenesis protein [Bacteroidota bacterium]